MKPFGYARRMRMKGMQTKRRRKSKGRGGGGGEGETRHWRRDGTPSAKNCTPLHFDGWRKVV